MKFSSKRTRSFASLKAMQVALLGWACTAGMANAAIYGPDNFASGGGTNLETMVMVKDGSNRLLVGGLFNTTEGQAGYQGIARYKTDDTLDTAFKVATDEFVKAIAVQSDGKILIGGQFHWVTPSNSATATQIWGIARLNADGTLDSGFTNAPAGQVKSNHNVRGIAVQSDGKIVIGGYFTSIDGTARNRITRLNANGTLDTSFNAGGTGANGNVEDVKLQSDGKILISGSFTQVNGVNRWGVARLNTDGTLDTTFNPGSVDAAHPGAWDGSYPVYQMAVQSDGKIVINGGNHRYANEIHWRVARLNTDGTPDSSFKSYINWWGSSVALQADGKIVVGGDFGRAGEANTSTGAVISPDAPRVRVARFNTDGTLDTAFDPGTGADAWVWAVLPQADGKIYIGGKFNNVNGTIRHGVARLAPLAHYITFPTQSPAVQRVGNGATFAISPVATSSAGLPIAYSSLTAGVCTVSGTTVTVVAGPGTCTIAANQPGNASTPAAPQVTQDVQIDQPPAQTITFPAQSPASRTVAAGAFQLNPAATASSGLAVSYSSLTASVCTVNSSTGEVTPVAGGTCTIAADQAGGTNNGFTYSAATRVTQNVTLQGTQTIMFPAQTPSSQSLAAGTTFAVSPVATSSAGLPVSYSSLTPGVCTVSGTSVTVVGTGTCTIAANQAGNTTTSAAAQQTQSVQVTALVVAPVPALSTWAVALLASLLGLMGFRRQRTQ